MIEKVVAGGQTGADQAALRAARAAGVATGGWAPRGWIVEATDGRGSTAAAEELQGLGLEEYPDGETDTQRYRLRSRANVRDSGATLILDASDEISAATMNAQADCKEMGRPFLAVLCGGLRYAAPPAPKAAAWVTSQGVRVLNVGGTRESKAPGVGAFVAGYLAEVLAILAATKAPAPRRPAAPPGPTNANGHQRSYGIPHAGANLFAWVKNLEEDYQVALAGPLDHAFVRGLGLDRSWKAWEYQQVQDAVAFVAAKVRHLPGYDGQFDQVAPDPDLLRRLIYDEAGEYLRLSGHPDDYAGRTKIIAELSATLPAPLAGGELVEDIATAGYYPTLLTLHAVRSARAELDDFPM